MRLTKVFMKGLSIALCIIFMFPKAAYCEGFYKISPQGVTPNFYYPYEIEVDISGNLYVTDSGNHSIQKLDSDGKKIISWGGMGTSDGYFNTPKGISMDKDRNIFIVDSGNNRIQKFSSDGNWIRTWGGYGSENGLFSNPTGIDVDNDGNIYVTDTGNSRIQKFNSTGEWVASFTDFGVGTEDFGDLTGITVDDKGNIFVADLGSYCVYKIDVKGQAEKVWTGYSADDSDSQIGVSWDNGSLYITDSYNRSVVSLWFDEVIRAYEKGDNSENGKLMKPCGIAVDMYGTIYVTDLETHNIDIFDHSGNWISKIGVCGTEDGQFYSPRGIAVDRKGDIYIADEKNKRIQKIKPDGTWMQTFGKEANKDNYIIDPNSVAIDKDGYIYMLDTRNCKVLKFRQDGTCILSWGNKGSGQSQFRCPKGIATDIQGNIYVTDLLDNCIQKFSSDGSFIAKWGSSGNKNGQFLGAAGIAVDKDGFIYVTETENCRIQKLNFDGSWAATIGSKGTENEQFEAPEGIVVDINGYIYVCDTGNDRIQIFKPNGVWQETIGVSGSDNSKFHGPVGIAIGIRGQIYVADTGNNRIQVLKPEIILGDFDKDGDYNSNDYTRMIAYVMGRSYLQDLEYDLIAGDINGDWVVDTTDLCYVKIDAVSGYTLPVMPDVESSTGRYSVDVSIPDVEGTPGSKIEVPVIVTGIPEEGIVSYGFSIKYNSEVFCLVNDKTPDVTGDVNGWNTENIGYINYFYNVPKIPLKDKIVANINLKIKDTVAPGKYSVELKSLGVCSCEGEYVYSGDIKFSVGEIIVKSTITQPIETTPTAKVEVTTPTPTPKAEVITPTPTPTAKAIVIPRNDKKNSENTKPSKESDAVAKTSTPTPTKTLTPTPITSDDITPPMIIEPSPTEKPAAGYKFIDIEGHWAEKYIVKLAEKEIINGYEDGTMRPDQSISRNEAIVILVTLMKLKLDDDPELYFSDKDSIPPWVKPYLGVAQNYGFIKGYNDYSFRGDNNLTRAEGSALIIKLLSITNKKGFDTNTNGENGISRKTVKYRDFQNSHWAKNILDISIEKGIINGYPDNTLKPDNNVTRAEFCTMVSVLMEE